jgi:hypothetical protein
VSDTSSAHRPHIERTAFARRFQEAAEASVAFAALMVRQALPPSRRFLIEPNASSDGNPLVDDERVFPDDSLPPGRMLGPLTFAEALDWLWRDGQVPEWVDVSVYREDGTHTDLRLRCCGRFTGLEQRLYYPEGYAPFGIKSPDLPSGWESVEQSGQFELPRGGRRRTPGALSNRDDG